MSRRNFVKSCLFAALVSISTSLQVFAGMNSYPAFESDISGYDTDAGIYTQFNLNTQTGQAWIKSNLYTRELNERGLPRRVMTGTVKSFMDGLSFDSELSQIVYKQGDVQTACASVTQRRGFFGSKLLIQMTENCSLKSEIEYRKENNGNRTFFKKILKVTLDVSVE